MDEKDGTRPDANRVMVWFTNRRCVRITLPLLPVLYRVCVCASHVPEALVLNGARAAALLYLLMQDEVQEAPRCASRQA